MDSKFVIPSIGLGTYQFVGGIIANSVMHGYLTPGYVLPDSVAFYKSKLASEDNYTWTYQWYVDNKYKDLPTVTSGSYQDYLYYLQRWPNIYLVSSSTTWDTSFAIGVASADGSTASIVHSATGKKIGSVNLITGEWELDTSLLAAGILRQVPVMSFTAMDT